MKKSIWASLASVAVVGAAVGVYYWSKKKQEDEAEADDAVNFISIHSDDEDDTETAEEDSDEEDIGSSEVEQIHRLYPYLSKAFIAKEFKENLGFLDKYPSETLIEIEHHLHFDDPKKLSMFADLAEENGYTVNLTDDHSCTVSRKMFTEEGSILTEIYNVANQVLANEGIYEEYLIK